ncbi:hypothetical protein [Knoellia subterranea]|uniref:Uncharacterized protein n=1 Tax=Knoellia subterranea KCTC 19937 TaxID=1385521 RepID=A0A0A0JQ68_9MICO|nr:hypothetical protein [Knoellia subterranea]KGN39580.1 hypothetical protein N803_01675 [Knoellia subterranea KCTC 19937]
MNTTGNDTGRRGADVMDALRAADPATRADLTRTDDRAFTALREGITMTAREQAGTTKRRGRRTLVAGGLALALLGGGTAYAGLNGFEVFNNVPATWKGGGTDGGVTCLSVWVDPQSPDAAKGSTGGPELSADPIADCQKYQEMAGKPPIADPVAFTHGGMTYVTPKKAVPPSADPAPTVKPNADAPTILRATLGDYVDGGNSRCFTGEEASEFVAKEMKRLGLTGIKVIEQPIEDGDSCAAMDHDPGTGEVIIFEMPGDPSRPSGHGGYTHQISDVLREGIAEKCVSLSEAEAVATKALGKFHHWPTSAVEDKTLKCTTVDVQAGGSIQIFLRGPK